MMSRYKPSGFSLIELVVVLAIVSVLMALTGGLVQKNVAQQERIVELEKVRQLFQQKAYQAFFTGQSFKFRLQENKLILPSEGIEQQQQNALPQSQDEVLIEFNQLVFVAQDYQVLTNGSVEPSAFSVIYPNDIKQFELAGFFGELDE